MSAKQAKSHETEGMSRRNFLAISGTAALGAIGAAGMAGCSPTGKTEVQPSTDAANEQTPAAAAFETAPDPIDDSKISETVESDIVVIGAGTAGLTCALAAAEEGKTVTVIAKDDAPSGQGGSHFAINTKLTKELGIDYDVDEAITHEMQLNGYRVDAEQWKVFAQESGPAMDWYMDIMGAGGLQCTLETPAPNNGGMSAEYPGSHIFFGGPNDQPFGDLPDELAILSGNITEQCGQKVIFNTTARQLVREADGTGRVSAVIAENADGKLVKYVGAEAVVLATGDYGNNEEMIEKYCPQAMGLMCMKEPANNTGDGHKMGLWVGATMQKNPAHAAMIFGVMDTYRALMVNENGTRIGNERVSNAFDGMQILMQPNKHAFSIWDADYASKVPTYPSRMNNEAATAEATQASFDEGVKAGTILKADTIEELAKLAGIDPDGLKASVERYNELCANGRDDDYGKASEFLIPVEKAPFFASEGKANLLITMGGLDVNVDMQVLDAEGKTIEGLYALGAVAGNFFANNYTTYFAGANLGRNICFGYRVGKALASA